MAKRIIQVEEKVPANLLIPLSIQHMFAMFGASVLVPLILLIELLLSFRCRKSIVKSMIKVAVRYRWTENE